MRCAECDCEKGADECTWIRTAPAEPTEAVQVLQADMSSLAELAQGYVETIVRLRAERNNALKALCHAVSARTKSELRRVDAERRANAAEAALAKINEVKT
jgi:hypothetical protein